MAEFSTYSLSTYTEQRLSRKLKSLQKQIADLELFITNPPFIIIYGIQEILPDATTVWEDRVKEIFMLNNINTNWILDIINPSNSSHPDSLRINLISHAVRENIYLKLSNYVSENAIDAIISKDDI
jgi:hypothetical protein